MNDKHHFELEYATDMYFMFYCQGHCFRVKMIRKEHFWNGYNDSDIARPEVTS